MNTVNTLDLTNFSCPWLIIKTKQAMDRLVRQEKLLVKTNDASFIIDCKAYTKQTGNKLLSNWCKDNNVYYCLLQKQGN